MPSGRDRKPLSLATEGRAREPPGTRESGFIRPEASGNYGAAAEKIIESRDRRVRAMFKEIVKALSICFLRFAKLSCSFKARRGVETLLNQSILVRQPLFQGVWSGHRSRFCRQRFGMNLPKL